MTREEAKETLEEMIKLGDLYEVDIEACEIAIEALKQEPKTGHWIQAKRPFNFRFKCSECGKLALKSEQNGNDAQSKYCPRCGARMESEEQA